MDKAFLRKTAVFRGMTDEELDSALVSLTASERSYLRDEVILHAGDTTGSIGLVTEGSVRIESNDIRGSRSILSDVGRGQVFAESYAVMGDEALTVDAVAGQDCRVLMLRISPGSISPAGAQGGSRGSSAGSGAGEATGWRIKLMSNLLEITARKNLVLSRRIFHTSPKSIRARVMSYLSSVSVQEGSDEFDIPFDRQELADYLNVDRTALSKELGRMRRDGLITFRKSRFRLRSQDGSHLPATHE